MPDGRRFLYLNISSQSGKEGIYVGSLDSQQTKFIVGTAWGGAYAQPGFLLFMREQTLMAQVFDSKTAELGGEPFPVVDQVATAGIFRNSLFSVSNNGLITFRSGSTSNRQLTWLSREGKSLGVIGELAGYGAPALSPDGKRMAAGRATRQVAAADIWLFELSRGTGSRFTFHPAVDTFPVWSPDGDRIVFTSRQSGPDRLYVKASKGVGKEEVVLKINPVPDHNHPSDWSPDGRYVIYETEGGDTKWDLWLLPFFGDGQPRPFLQSEFNEQEGQFSPDGKWVAFTSDESGKNEVYIESFPTLGEKLQVSTSGGRKPRWRKDGKELFYIAGDRKLVSVAIQSRPNLEAALPQALFETHVADLSAIGIPYAVAADGQRFLFLVPAGETITPPFHVIVNWTAELKKQTR